MKNNDSDSKWYFLVAIILLLLSALSYSIQIFLFHHNSDTYFYFLQDLSFVPIQVLVVTFIIDRLLKRQQKIDLFKKVYVSIGIFYNELGNELLKSLFELTTDKDKIGNKLNITIHWGKKEFTTAWNWLNNNPVELDVSIEKIQNLKTFLDSKRIFILNLLENSNLSEHDTFTDTLLAVCHLSDELALRENLPDTPRSDLSHLNIDIKRAYNGIIREWVLYLDHIRKEYPFLYSLSLRSNPFNNKASVIIEE